MDNKQLYFEELETVEELGWVEAGVGTVIWLRHLASLSTSAVT